MIDLKENRSEDHRIVVFLDQNYLNNFAKLQLGRLDENELIEPVSDLLETLFSSVVEKHKAICVEGLIQRDEASKILDSKEKIYHLRDNLLFNTMTELSSRLSCGLHSLDPESNLRNQTIMSIVFKNGMLSRKHFPMWRLGLSRNPDDDTTRHTVTFSGTEFQIYVPWRKVEKRYRLNSQWAEKNEEYRNERNFKSMSEASDALVDVLREVAGYLNNKTNWVAGIRLVNDGSINKDSIAEFILSPKFSELPYVKIKCSLEAAVLTDRDRPIRASDHYDIETLSLVVPFCDLVLTDRYMATLINSHLNLGNTTVLGGRIEDYKGAAKILKTTW